MRIGFNKSLLILLVTLLLSIIFYIIQLFYVSSSNNLSSRIYEQSLVASINQFEYLPALVSKDPTLRQIIIEPKTDHLLASQKLKFIAERSGADAVYLMDNKGNVKAASNYENRNGGFLYHNYSFRPYFSGAMAKGTRQFYYAKGATTGIPGFFISSPIMEKNITIGVAVVKLDLRHWEDKWSSSTENIAVVDHNNIIILSSVDPWRYKSIGKLPETTLEKIDLQQQFPGQTHTNLYSKSININVSNNTDQAFWLIDQKLYLVNNFDIPETGWKLYYLVNHNAILTYSSIFFVVISILAFLAQLNIKNRKHILESRNKHRLLEVKRREELQTVMDNIHIGVILLTESGLLLSTNEHAKHLLLSGRSLEKSTSTYINELIDIDHQSFDNILLEDISAPAYHETNAVHNGKKSIPIMFAISKVNTMDEETYLMTIVNIKRRKVAENELVKINSDLENIIENRTKELKETQYQLMQKNKAAALGNMAATIVHELSQPLTAMKSSVAAINAKIKKNDWQGALESTDRLAPLNTKMHNVIKLLKFFSYQDKKSYETINIIDTIGQSLENVNDILQEKLIQVKIDHRHTKLLINASPIKVDLIISNIIQNAIDALDSTENPTIHISTTNDYKWAQIRIEDNAGGVDKNIMEKLFSPYFTTKEVGKGLGLGLAITYEIIQEYGGNIIVENIQQGARFTIKLPLKEQNYLVSVK